MVTPVPGWTLVWTNLGSSWPHLRTGQWRTRMRDLGRANAFTPRGTHLWGTGDSARAVRAGQHVSGLAGEGA